MGMGSRSGGEAVSVFFCDTPTCPVYSYTVGRFSIHPKDALTRRALPVCPVCGDLGDSLDENGNPPPSEVET